MNQINSIVELITLVERDDRYKTMLRLAYHSFHSTYSNRIKFEDVTYEMSLHWLNYWLTKNILENKNLDLLPGENNCSTMVNHLNGFIQKVENNILPP